MDRLTRALLWVYVFTLPWDVVALALPGIGAASRLVGAAAIASAVLTIALRGRFRRPDAILVFAIMFAIWSALSLFWTVSADATSQSAFTYAQLVASVWVMREFAGTSEQRQSLLAAFCLGAFVPLVGLLNNFMMGVRSAYLPDRVSADGFNADDLALMLVMGIPMAWFFVLRKGWLVRLVALAYVALAPFAILLTGTRGAFLALVVAVSIVPISLPRRSLRSYSMIAALTVGVAVTAAVLVPVRTWDRIFTIGNEVQSGNMTGRRDIWEAGWQVFQEHPLLGVGAGAYATAVEPILRHAQVSHNTPLGVLVEQGTVGFCVFTALLFACAWTIVGLPPADRKMWAVLMLAWLIGVTSLNWESRKVTWLLFGLLSAQGGVQRTRRRVSRPEQAPLPVTLHPHSYVPQHSPQTDRMSVSH